MEETTTIPPDRYHPLPEGEFIQLREILDSIVSHMPEGHASLIWNTYNRVRGVQERQPCTCGSSGRYWGEAVSYLKNWVKERI